LHNVFIKQQQMADNFKFIQMRRKNEKKQLRIYSCTCKLFNINYLQANTHTHVQKYTRKSKK